VAALACAFTALCAVREAFVAVGSRTDGFIMLPPLRLWGSSTSGEEAWADVEINRALVAASECFPEVERIDLPRRDGR
jgi:hypothetical protein